MYIVIDTLSRNVLGEFDSLVEAKSLYLGLVAATPDAYRDLRVLSDGGVEQIVPQQEVHDALRSAIA